MAKTVWQFLLLSLIFIFSCKSNDIVSNNNGFDFSQTCVVSAQVDDDLFANGPSDDHTIQNAYIEDNCMFIEFSAGGCSGDSWELELYGEEAVDDSFPPQRSIRLSLLDSEDCEAWITKEASFEISAFKVSSGEVLLNLEGFDQLILYSN